MPNVKPGFVNLGGKVSSKPTTQSQENIFIAVNLDIHDVINTGPHLSPDVWMKTLLHTGSYWFILGAECLAFGESFSS